MPKVPVACARRAFILLALLASGCATVPQNPAERAVYEEINDPLEPMNRGIFQFNQVVDGVLIKPLAQIYRGILPQEVRDSLRHFLDNLKEPLVFANKLLQGDPERAGITAARFAINSTVGAAGLFDVASKLGYEQQVGDFGQTLFVWGVPDGPYLVLPIFGPSNPRDAVGKGVDSYADPVSFVGQGDQVDDAHLAAFLADGIDRRSRVLDELERIKRSSIDYYAQIRSLSRQHRTEELYNGNPPAPTINEELYQDPLASPAAK